MSARRLALQALLVCCVVVLGVSGSASGALTHSLSSSFTAESFVEGVALDGSGDVYVYDASGSGTVHKYSPSGVPVVFSATGTNAIENVEFNGTGEVAVDDSSGASKGDIYVATGNRVAIYAPTGALLGELNGSIETEVPATQGVWGGPCGVAVGGDGSVYVGLSSGHVFKYVPSANPAANTDYNSSLNGLESVCNVAVDSSGSVYTSTPGGAVHKYAALQFGVLSATGTMLSELGGSLAVDASNDDVYVDQENQVVQYDSTGVLLTTSNGGEEAIGGSFGIAVTAGTLYVGDNNLKRIDILAPAAIVPDLTLGQAEGVTTTSETLHGTVNPDGVGVTSCRYEYGTRASGAFAASVPCTQDPGSGNTPIEVSATVNGLTANTPYQFRLAAENVNGKVVTLSTEFTTLSTPLIESESPRQVASESASIEARINPMGSATTYRVEYGTDTSYGQQVPALTDSTAGSGSAYTTVKQVLDGLLPGTAYHFRVVATNANGSTNGPDRLVRTPAASVPVLDECPNSSIRTVQHASLLPECRAYEMVSPVDKSGGEIAALPKRTQSAVNGDSIKFFSKTAFGDAIGSEQPGAEYIADRGSEGWATHSINPEQGSGFLNVFSPSSYVGLSPDLSKGVFFAHTPVLPGHPNVEHLENLYLRTDLQSPGVGQYELLSDAVAPVAPLKGEPTNPTIAVDAASADWSHVLFESYSDLTADTSGLSPTRPKVYEWDNGVLEYAGVLPSSSCASPPCIAPESVGGNGAGISTPSLGGTDEAFKEEWSSGAMSADGSRVVFQAGQLVSAAANNANTSLTKGDLYMRIDKATTIQLNASERSTPDPRGDLPARFLAATSDDSKVFFESEGALTDDAEMPDNNLYMYDLDAPAGKHLTLITVDREPNDGGYLRVEGVPIPAISQDGSFIYFLGDQTLIAGQPPLSEGGSALYVWHDGSLRFVTEHGFTSTQSPGAYTADPKWGESGVSNYPDDFRMSADGRKVVFLSNTPYIAKQAGIRPDPNQRLYLYDYDTAKITCISCNPNGELSTGSPQIEGFADTSPFQKGTQYSSHAMSSDGRYVFFDTPDSLVAQDTNGRRDVYEYDTLAGEVHLLSGGTCDCDATFADATPGGSNVFFTTRQRLVRTDIDDNSDMYDVRIDGGIPAQNQASPVSCEGEECRGPATSPPALQTPSSANFVGAGNPKPAIVKVQAKRKRPTLTQALKACKRKPKKQRSKCRARVRKAYHANRATTVRTHRRAGR